MIRLLKFSKLFKIFAKKKKKSKFGGGGGPSRSSSGSATVWRDRFFMDQGRKV